VAGIVPGATRTNLGGPSEVEMRGPLQAVEVAEPEGVAKAALEAFDANDPTRIHGTRNARSRTGSPSCPKRPRPASLPRSRWKTGKAPSAPQSGSEQSVP
jgi:short-subunit dehydrogenase